MSLDTSHTNLTRRGFVTGTALAGASLAAAGTALASEQANSDTAEAGWDAEYDVIVCGGGGAGLTAAYSALESGATSVLVLEKADSCGGTTATAEGAIQASGTSWQKELGVNGVEDDNAEKHYAFWMQDGEGLVEPDLVRCMADNAADNLQWMADSFGITFAKVFGCYPAAYTDLATMADRIHLIADAADTSKTGGIVWTTNAQAAVEAAGGEIQTGVAVASLVKEGNAVTGVVTADGRRLGAKAVILAMSGIEHNEELAKRYNPQQYWDLKTQNVATAATDTGDGIVMGIEAGAQVGRFGGAVDLLLQTWSYTNNTNPEIPYLLVNQRGVRFVREDTTYAFHCRAIYNACIQEGGFDEEAGTTGACWMVMDNKMTSVPQADWSDPDKLQAALDDGSMVTGETVEELSKLMGIDPAVLTRTVDTWNSDIASGIDPVWRRMVQLTPLDEPPFYAWKTVNTNIGSIGGLKIDTNAQVIGRDGEPIVGLYAAGTNAGGWLGPYYPGSGTCLQGVLNWGRIAGSSAAAAL